VSSDTSPGAAIVNETFARQYFSGEHPLGKRGREVHAWHIGDERANEADEIAAKLTEAGASVELK